MLKNIPIIILLFLCFTACNSAIKPESLYGKWKYIKVANPNASPPDSVTAVELSIQMPNITFTKNDSLVIYWGGKVLSHGTFRIEDRNIQFKEIMADGKTREFPFYIESFTDKQLVFSTKGADGSVVTAVKE